MLGTPSKFELKLTVSSKRASLVHAYTDFQLFVLRIVFDL